MTRGWASSRGELKVCAGAGDGEWLAAHLGFEELGAGEVGVVVVAEAHAADRGDDVTGGEAEVDGHGAAGGDALDEQAVEVAAAHGVVEDDGVLGVLHAFGGVGTKLALDALPGL